MVELLIVIYIVWYIVKKKNKDTASKFPDAPKPLQKKRASAIPNRPKKNVSAVPNVPKRIQRDSEESVLDMQMRESRRRCTYEAAYSKGLPDRVGKRGDYDPITPKGMVRIRCAYCNAENFVPSGTREHYHCYFCWEKL
ncbi:MAG: hypothetical protein IKV59_06540 [Lachnospiraceae bacterium]|nr:hypothetical protein [Lachnospiraceae bacterium]